MTHRLIVGGELVLYGDVGDLWGDGSGFTAREVIEALADLGDDDITVRLNSGGGFAFEGTAIHNALRAHPGRVTISVDAIAASAASTIAMAGDRIVMRAGAMLMIHDPSAVTVGTADDHRESADRLDGLATVVAGIYARRSGRSLKEIRKMMVAETWLDADGAVELGFATETDKAEIEPVARFDYAIYSKTPAEILQSAQRARPPARVQGKEPNMSNEQVEQATLTLPRNAAPAEPSTEPARSIEPANPATPKDVTREIMSRCRAARMSLEEAEEIVEAAGGSIERAKDLIINRMADRDPGPHVRTAMVVTTDQLDRFKEGAKRALLFRAGFDGGEVNEFSSMTLRELARESLVRAGIKQVWTDPMMMIGMAMGLGRVTMASPGMHSTSDFVEILANIANKAMLKGYLEAEETFEAWTARGVLVDFKPVKRVDLNLFPSLLEVPEGAEYKYATIGDRGETIQLATFGRMFPITRQAVVNDDMNVFTRIPARMGRAARRTIGNFVYAILNGNPAMSDALPLFHVDHGNLAGTGGPPTVGSLDAARAAIARQRDPDEHVAALNIRPRFFLVPVELEGVAATLMTSEFDPSKTQRVPNHVRGLAQVISDARLSNASTKAWYMAADPAQHDTIEVSYLNGNNQPTLEQREGWNVDGVEFKVRIDAGVKALDFRGLYKDPGE